MTLPPACCEDNVLQSQSSSQTKGPKTEIAGVGMKKREAGNLHRDNAEYRQWNVKNM